VKVVIYQGRKADFLCGWNRAILEKNAIVSIHFASISCQGPTQFSLGRGGGTALQWLQAEALTV
jgi:hypothetical protein